MERKVALITGSGTGIGRAIALRLAKGGNNVIINYSRSEQEALNTKDEVEKFGARCLALKCSVDNDEEVNNMIKTIIEEFGKLDILVNCAGVTNFVDHNNLTGLKEEYWDRAFNVNVKGMFFCCRAASSELKKQKGKVINITSVAGQNGLGSSIAYAASKAAADSVTKSLARVLAPEVTVNSIAPGVINTRWASTDLKHMHEDTPLERIGEPEDVANMVWALLNFGTFVTGEIIRVDGGKFI